MGEMEVAAMPRIERYDDNRIASLLRRKRYTEALACAAESNIALLVRIMLAKCAAQVYLKQYRDSRFTTRRANQIAGICGRRTLDFERTYGMLTTCLKDLENAAAIGTVIEGWLKEQTDNEIYRRKLDYALEMQCRIEAEFTNLATSLLQRLCELIVRAK
jgi:hypothetical protein